MSLSPPEPISGFPRTPRRLRLVLGLIVVVSLGLRLVIAWRGGQWFWPDEERFETSRRAAHQLLGGHCQVAAHQLLQSADHLLFKVFAVIPALVEQRFQTPINVPALFFAIVSAWTLWLVGRVARHAGADDLEQVLAVFLAACACSLFYYARHFVPYDLALGLSLLGLCHGLREPASWRRSLLTGFWASLGFLTYNGYWVLGAAFLVVHVARAWPEWRGAARRAWWALVGLVLPITAVLAAGWACGNNLLDSFRRFSGSVLLGNFGIAWRVIGEYFWVTEHLISVLWVAAFVVSIALAVRRRAGPRILLWLALSGLLYAALVVPSDVVRIFTVPARQVRVLAPFLCLLTAALLARAWRAGGWWCRSTAFTLTLVAAQAAVNFTAPLYQLFPTDFRELADRFIPTATARDFGPYRVVNCYFLHDPSWAENGPDAGEVVLRRPHPFQFQPYLYESYSEAMRTRYRQRDCSMRIIRLAAGGPPFAGYPGVIALSFRLPLEPKGTVPEPFLTTGKTSVGDVLFLSYDTPATDLTRFHLGHDHWGAGAITSAPVQLARGQSHTVIIAFGSLFPPENSPLFQQHPEWLVFKHHLYVSLDGVELFNLPADFHPSQVQDVTLGHNFIGASTAGHDFTAEILRVERLAPADILQHLKTASPQQTRH